LKFGKKFSWPNFFVLFDAANIHFLFSTMQYIVLNKLQFIDFQYTFSQKTYSKRVL
jgi:hypothetical protein